MIHKIYNATAKITACGKQVLSYDLDDFGNIMEVATPRAFGGAYWASAANNDVEVTMCKECHEHKPTLGG